MTALQLKNIWKRTHTKLSNMENEETYVTGYNQGYKLVKYSPELFERIKDTLSEGNEYDRGLLEGAAQAEKEKEQQRLAELQSLQAEQEPEQDMER